MANQALLGLSAVRERTGATTVTAKFLAANLDEGLTTAATGDYNGFIRTQVRVDQDESGTNFIVTATYEGGEEGGGGGGGSQSGDDDPSDVYDWSPSFEQADILTHPKIDNLLKKYEGTIDPENGTIRWAEELKPSAASGLGGGNNQSTKNPMLGVREFLSLGGVWSRKKLYNQIPPEIFTSVGKITESVPGGLPDPGNRFWLTMPPIVTQRGNKWEVTERWMLSGVDSDRAKEAAKDIYEAGGGRGL
jgi:hypothetical protein